MRLLHVITTLDPNHGGPPAVALRIAAAQAAAGHEVTILAYRARGDEARVARSLESIPGVKAVRLALLDPPTGAERVLGGGARRALRSRVASVDALQLHGVWDTIVRVAGQEAGRAGVPYAVTPHGMLDPWCLGATPAKRWKKRLALALAYRRVLNGASFLHVLNRDERDLMKPLGLIPPTEVVPNGVFLEEFASLPPREAFRASRAELRGRPYLLFLSRVHPKKGLDLLAEGFAAVAAEHPDVQLVVAGPDDGALEPLRHRCRELGIAERVHPVGALYGPDKLAALAGAEAFCLTSRQEGFSMAVTEAMAAGVAVVVSDQCHFPEVEEVGAGRIVRLDRASIAAGLREVLADAGRRAAMGRAGRALVETRYTWPRIAEAITASHERHGRR